VRLAITGSTGRLGGALVSLAGARPGWAVAPWTRADFDLDAPGSVDASLDRARPDLVLHCAAWTDVDACAREPERALQRNGVATGVLAAACAARGVGLVMVSTNEVFDGRRTDRIPYSTTDEPRPGNAYGASKLLGEQEARNAFGPGARAGLWIVRTAWLFGAPGNDFPMKIIAAARAALADGRTLSLVADEVGSPTYAPDLAGGILDLAADPATAGLHHVVNDGAASRATWARQVLADAGIEVPTADVSIDAWPRASTPPRWAVLAPSPLPTLGRLRPWEAALSAYLGERLSESVAAPS